MLCGWALFYFLTLPTLQVNLVFRPVREKNSLIQSHKMQIMRLMYAWRNLRILGYLPSLCGWPAYAGRNYLCARRIDKRAHNTRKTKSDPKPIPDLKLGLNSPLISIAPFFHLSHFLTWNPSWRLRARNCNANDNYETQASANLARRRRGGRRRRGLTMTTARYSLFCFFVNFFLIF